MVSLDESSVLWLFRCCRFISIRSSWLSSTITTESLIKLVLIHTRIGFCRATENLVKQGLKTACNSNSNSNDNNSNGHNSNSNDNSNNDSNNDSNSNGNSDSNNIINAVKNGWLRLTGLLDG